MNQDLMDMARQAGIQEGEFERYKGEDGKRKAYMMLPEEFEAFAKLVAAAEREACAKVIEPKNPRPCDCTSCDCGNSGDLRAVVDWDAAVFSANLIRARGETK